MDVNTTYFGFTNNIKPMQKAKVENLLCKVKRYNGIILSNEQFIFNEILAGSKLKVIENYQYYKRNGELSKPKNDYRLYTEENTYYEIEKTLYDFACYLIENGFNDEEKAREFITAEQKRIEAEKQIETEKLAKEKEKKEWIKQENINFANWLNEQTEQYNNIEKLEILKQIFLDEVGQFGGGSIRLLVLIDNFDNPKCKETLKDWLHYYNTASLKTFFHVTGINLGKTDKEIQTRLNEIKSSKDFQEMIPYKKRQQKQNNTEEKQETFYIMIQSPKPHFEEVTGEYINKYGLDMFIREHNNNYLITECKSGMLLAQARTKKELFNRLKELINRFTIENVNKRLEEVINKFGLSPKYREVITV